MTFRLLRHPAADGAWNMALDEAILDAYSTSAAAGPPTLRLYAFDPPALSLGRRQAASGAHDPAFCRREGIALVRRPTGGGAVLHEHELTYAVIGRLREAPFPGGVLETYRTLALALAAALARLGVAARIAPAAIRGAPARAGDAADPSCFARLSSHEIEVGGRKLVGSAQLRRKGAFLQHGSILLRSEPRRLAAVLGRSDTGPPGFTDLEREIAVAPGASGLADAVIESFGAQFGAPLLAGGLAPGEIVRAHQLRCWKYTSCSWTLDGRLGLRERRWGPPLG